MLVVGIAGKQLDDVSRAVLDAPEVSGVILFTRNFGDREQVCELVAAIRERRPGPFLLCVDQEGGPVQRFRDDFTRLPALARIGEVYMHDRAHAVALAEEHAWVMASEIRAVDVDLSFAPVVDLQRGNRAIGERAFHLEPAAVSELSLAYLRGMHLAGMAATLKHFPGHGSVLEDTHFDSAVDPRPLNALLDTDLLPFADGIAAGAEAVMMAHVTYPAVDPLPAGHSRTWISDILRGQLGFGGVVFSDDISMVAAHAVGGIAARIHLHLDAGCDLVLACQPDGVREAIAAARGRTPCDESKIARLMGEVASTWTSLQDNPQRRAFLERLATLNT